MSMLAEILRAQETPLLAAWMTAQKATATRRALIGEAELERQSGEFLVLLQQAATQTDASGGATIVGDIGRPAYREMKQFLETVTASRTQLGYSPSETARFVFSLKTPLYDEIRRSVPDPSAQLDAMSQGFALLDSLGLFVTEVHQKVREGIIQRQQQEMLELSTPVVKLWEGVLALPIIGTLDSARTQTIMESLLERIVASGSEIAIIDITGVPTVDTLTAQHLLKTVTAARLMGAECIISGIRPQIAQTIVHLGVEMGDVVTKATLADAFKVALERSNLAVVRRVKA